MAGKFYEDFVQKGRPWWKILTGILFSNAGLFILCIIFAALGAFVFIQIELPNEELERETKLVKNLDVEDAINYLKNIFWIYAKSERYNLTSEEYQISVVRDLDTLKKFVVTYYNDYNYDTTNDWTYSWTFPKALLYTLTIMTTIGYGHISTKTIAGKMLAIGYSLVGIPLLLVFMGKIGDRMAILFRYAYSRLFCRWCRVRRREAELAIAKERVSKDHVGKEIYMPTDLIHVPSMVSMLLLIVYLFAGAVAFSVWEEWNLGAAFYFSFVSLTTLGFGDLWPRKCVVEYSKDLGHFMRFVFAIAYLIIGIALLSMCIQLMQEEIMMKISFLAEKFGMGSKKEEEEYVKVTKVDRLLQTPADMTGNELDFNQKRRKKKMINKEEEEVGDIHNEAFFEEDHDSEFDFI